MSQEEVKLKRLESQIGIGVNDEQPSLSAMGEGASQLAVTDGLVKDIKKVNGSFYESRLFKSFGEQSNAILNNESTITARHKFIGDPIFDPGLGAETFQTGWSASGGTGFKIYKDGSEYHAEFDGLIVRGTMRVFELLLQQIRATNGSIFVTSAAKTDSVTGSAGTEAITFEDPNEENSGGVCPFIEDDIILSQRFNIGSTSVISRKVRRVVSVSGKTATVASDLTGQPSTSADEIAVAGDDFVRIGSTTNAARRGGIYMSSDDPNSPFIVIFDGVTSWSDWTNSSNKTKARLGRLDGITDATAGLDGNQTNTFGLYSDDVYLKGHINATTGLIGGVNLVSNKIYVGTGTYNNSNTAFYLGSDGNLSLKDKLTWDGSTLSVSGSITVTGGNAETTTGSQTKATAAQVAATAAAATDATSKADSAEADAKAASLLRASYLTSNTTTINGGTITTGSIAADRIVANSITADQIDAGTITATEISTLSMSGKSCVFDTGSVGGFTMGASTLTTTGAGIGKTGQNQAFWAGSDTQNSAEFRVNHAGDLVASSATITGSITSDSGTFGGWTINGNGMYRGTAVASGSYTGSASDITIGAGWISANKFRVDSDGTAHFKGTLDANTTGTLSHNNCSLTDITADNITAGTISAAEINMSSGLAQITTGGDVTTKRNVRVWSSDVGDGTRYGLQLIKHGAASITPTNWWMLFNDSGAENLTFNHGGSNVCELTTGGLMVADQGIGFNSSSYYMMYDNGHILVYLNGFTDGGSIYPYDASNSVSDGYDLGKSNKKWRKLFVTQSNVGDLVMANNDGTANWTLREKPDCILARNSITQKTFKLNMTETSEYDSEVWDEND